MNCERATLGQPDTTSAEYSQPITENALRMRQTPAE